MKIKYVTSIVLFIAAAVLAPQALAQANGENSPANRSSASSSAQVKPAADFPGHYLWTEQFDGSINSEGHVMELDSTVGYVFSRHFGVDGGIPVYFVRDNSTTSTGGMTTTSNNGVGDAYLQLRLAFPSPVLNYKTTLTGTAPTGDSSVGFSTGHATYDWTNHIDHGFGRWRPFAEAGVGNSTPEDFAFHRPYESYGHVAHFQAGTGFEIFQWLGASASAYDIAPWGTQTISSRLVNGSANALGRGGGHGRVFDLANQTTGSSSLAADNGFNAGADVSAGPLVDFSLGYSHSVHFDLNTFSFGIGINMSQVLHQARKGM